MNIIDYALQMELDGKAFYERSAQHVAHPELKKILLNLADEEQRHYQFFKRLKDGQEQNAAEEIKSSSPTLDLNKTLFRQMAEQGKQSSFGADVRKVWEEALKIEEKVERMYREEAGKEPDADRKQLLARIADEEKNHVYLIDNMLSFMADPQGFTDSADYKNFLSWEGR
jgi:rubrerythrin